MVPIYVKHNKNELIENNFVSTNASWHEMKIITTTENRKKKLASNIYNKWAEEKVRTYVYLGAGFLFCGDRNIFFPKFRMNHAQIVSMSNTTCTDRMFRELTPTFYRKLTCIMLVYKPFGAPYTQSGKHIYFFRAFGPSSEKILYFSSVLFYKGNQN